LDHEILSGALMLERRTLLQLITGGVTLAAGTRAMAAPAPSLPVPPGSDDQARMIWARLVADLSGRPVFFFTHGNVWGFKPQADDLTVEQFAKRIYGYSGVAARKIERDGDGRLMLRQKSWAFYRDPVTDRITDQIPNPYTGRTDTARPLSGPERVRPLAELGANAMRIRRIGPQAVIETSNLARFKSPDISWHKLEANLEDYICRTADLDGDAPHIPNSYHQNLIAEWQTWTGMHGTPGHILFKGNGFPFGSLDEIPSDQIDAIERLFPGTLGGVSRWR
jgi:hypothetical protein